MHCLNVLLTVKDEAHVAEVAALLTQAGRLSRREPGCLRFEAYQSQTDPKRFMLIERWENAAALDVHRTGEAYTTIYQPKVLPLVEREGHPVQLLE